MSKQPVYGYPCVEDPNDFIPDGECCSPAEREAHRTACANFGKPSYEPNKGCFTEREIRCSRCSTPTRDREQDHPGICVCGGYIDDGPIVRHVLRTSWGIGTNLIATCDGCGEPCFDDVGLLTCHECGGPEFCAVCWPEHEKKHEEGRI